MYPSDLQSPKRREIHCIPLTTTQQVSSWRASLKTEERAHRIAAHNNQQVYRKPPVPLTGYMPPTRLAVVLAAANASRGTHTLKQGAVGDHRPESARLPTRTRLAERRPTTARVGGLPMADAAAARLEAASSQRRRKGYTGFLAGATKTHHQVNVELEEEQKRHPTRVAVRPHSLWQTDFDDPSPETIAAILTEQVAAEHYHAQGGMLNPWGTDRDLPKPIVPKLPQAYRSRPASSSSFTATASLTDTLTTGPASRASSVRVSSARSMSSGARARPRPAFLDKSYVRNGINLERTGTYAVSGSSRTWG